jgi:hypothetical protein
MSSHHNRLALYAAAAAACPVASVMGDVMITGALTGTVSSGDADVLTLTMGGVDINFNVGNFSSIGFTFWAVSAGVNGSAKVFLSSNNGADGYMSQFDLGDALSAPRSASQGVGFNRSFVSSENIPTVGQWAGAGNGHGYIGFESNGRTGWIEVTWSWSSPTSSVLTIGEYSIGAVGETMYAGVPAVPGLGGLTALACGAAGLRRTRKRTV